MPKMEKTEVGEIGIAALLYKCCSIATVEVGTKATVAHIRINNDGITDDQSVLALATAFAIMDS